MITRKVNGVKYTLKKGNVEKEENDVLFIWTVPLLDKGDSTFINIHREAGSLLYEFCLTALMKYGKENKEGKQELQVGQCIITEPAALPYYYVIHCVLPNHKIRNQKEHKQSLLLQVLRSGLELAKAQSEIKLDLYSLTIPPITDKIYGEVSNDDISKVFKLLFSSLNPNDFSIENKCSFNKVHFVFSTDEELKRYVKVFDKLTTTWFERIINKVFGNKY